MLDTSDIVLSFSTLYWFSGLTSLLAGTMQGATRVISDEPFSTNTFFKAIENFKVSVLFGPPSQMAMAVADPEIKKFDLSSVVTYVCGGSPVPHAIVKKMKEIMPKTTFIIGYGLSEIAGVASLGEAIYPRCNGQIVTNVRVKIVNENENLLGPEDVGELCIKTLFKWSGYYDNAEATNSVYDKDGWIYTGDQGYIDRDGNVFIVDRLKDIMKYNNFHFSPTEIEETINQMEGVAEVCVCGIPDVVSSSLPSAAIVKTSCSNLTEQEVYNYVAERLVHFKHLRGGVYFVDSVPKTPSGKNIRKDVQKICEKLRNSKLN